MIETFRDLFAYNAWANRVLFDACAALSSADYLKDLKSSHGGIHGTLCHLVWAEELWMTRWVGEPPPVVPQGKQLTGLAEVRSHWENVEARRAAWLEKFTDARLSDTVSVRPTSGGVYVHSFADMFRHLINHSSYHRGQVVTMLRQLGKKPPSTDLILFYREQQP
jgi:uncharacterized damage-inducible protein DinB